MSNTAKPSLTGMPEMDQPGRTHYAIALAIVASFIALQAAGAFSYSKWERISARNQKLPADVQSIGLK